MGLPPEITTRRDERHGSRLGDIIRRLSSSSDGEIVATVLAMRRILESAGVDVHGLAEHLEAPNGKGVTEADLKRVFDSGYAKGIEDTQNKQHGANDFRSTDGKPDWDSVALYLQRNIHRLDAKHHDFVNDMAARTVWGREPTERQHKYLHSLFYKLGGKIT
jgi:hypothetical protein